MSGGTPAAEKKGLRIVVLCGPNLSHKNTCATMIRSGLNVVGISMADQRTAGLPVSYLWRSLKKKGLGKTLSRIAARLAYMALNGHADRKAYHRIFDERAIEATLAAWGGEIFSTGNYGNAEALEWLREKRPDVLVVHTPYWVGKSVREAAAKGIVLGGHPGITPFYRGSHSAFWAVYRGQPQDVGCTVFLVDKGVDTGPIVAQDRIAIEPGDSFRTLAWKGMIRIAEMQAEALRNLDDGIELPRRVVPAPPNSEFDNPTLRQFLEYRFRQSWVR